MNLRPLPVRDRLRASAHAEIDPSTADAIREFLLLEACVGECESLASRVASDRRHDALLRALSECIAACETYLAAKARTSTFETRLRDYCVAALTETITACESGTGQPATRCRAIIRTAIQYLHPGRIRPGRDRQ